MIVKRQKKHNVRKEVYAQKPIICACQCNKNCKVDAFLNKCTWITSLVDNLLIMCDEIVDIPQSAPEAASIDSVDKKK